MLPGFGGPESKAWLPIFRERAEALSTKWLETIAAENKQAVEINVIAWLSRGALDSIGQGRMPFLIEDTPRMLTISIAAFGVQFNTIQDDSHPVAKQYENYWSVFPHNHMLPRLSLNFFQLQYFRGAFSKADFHTISRGVCSDMGPPMDHRSWFKSPTRTCTQCERDGYRHRKEITA